MFKHLKKLEVAPTSWLALPEVAPSARVLLAPATEANSAFYNAMLKRSGKRVRAMAARGSDQITAGDVRANRADDRALFPLSVLKGWDGIEDDAGNAVPFSQEAAVEFVEALPDWIFDRIRNHAATPERFVAVGEELPDPAELAGNSQSASAGS